ncbi:MAG: TonB-dependent receptor [Longimicrobiales bacterium]
METWLWAALKGLLALQLNQATVVGEVRDSESGEGVAGAIVMLSELARVALTDADGRYSISAVPPGPQHLSVQRIGYATRTLHALVPRQGVLQINIILRREPVVLPQIEVSRRLPMSGASTPGTPFPNQTLSIQEIRNHPLLAEPDVFLALTGGAFVQRPEAPSGIHLRGGSADQIAFLLDGIPVFNPFHAGGTFSAWNPDALEQLQVLSTLSGHMMDALSGTVSAVTRPPGSVFMTQGSASTTQARITMDGPLGDGAAGFLLSVRSGFPTSVLSPRDASYLRGETGDLLGKVEAPVLGGRFRLLGYGAENEFSAVSTVVEDDTQPVSSADIRHAFTWKSRSLGAQWNGNIGHLTMRALGWSATGNALADWRPPTDSAQELRTARKDFGVLALVEHKVAATSTVLGLSLSQSTTTYRVAQPGGSDPAFALVARTRLSSVFVQHEAQLGHQFTVQLGGSAVLADALHVQPQLQLRWQPDAQFTLTSGFTRTHQFSQSLRNPESLVGSIFPAELWVSASTDSVPLARSDLIWLAGDYRPTAGLRIGSQVYARDLTGLLLVAPRTGQPFATSGFGTGTGRAFGFSIDGTLSGARYGLIASYYWQHVRFAQADSKYIPEHGTQHSAEAGVILFPTSTFSARLGLAAAAGRQATAVAQAFEWEACNLLDRGCEFGGSPDYDARQIGRMRLPAYLRLDAGLRKHWHVRVARRNATIAAFGTLTNLFGQKNVLTVARDVVTGQPAEVQMRPRAPLVLGIDWVF